jgi:hypothetical protein
MAKRRHTPLVLHSHVTITLDARPQVRQLHANQGKNENQKQ